VRKEEKTDESSCKKSEVIEIENEIILEDDDVWDESKDIKT